LEEALDIGKPFIIMCLRRTYQKYRNVSESYPDRSSLQDSERRRLFDTLDSLENRRGFTIAGFDEYDFADELRRQLSKMFKKSVGLYEKRLQRQTLLMTFDIPSMLKIDQLNQISELAMDELEEKAPRKSAIRALARSRFGAEQVR